LDEKMKPYGCIVPTSMIALCVILLMVVGARARDLGQWGNSDPVQKKWYQELMQPDNDKTSCCGEADSYWADSFDSTDKGEYIAIITDQRPDEPLKRPPLAIGTRIPIPNHKIKWNEGNPTGHGIVFLSRTMYVYCYVPPGGV
jgi:hypothetical protein